MIVVFRIHVFIWDWILNLNWKCISFTVMILFLLSILGIYRFGPIFYRKKGIAPKKKNIWNSSWKFKIKISKHWMLAKVQIKDFAIQMFTWIFLILLYTSFLICYIPLLPLKYQTKPIKCLEMRAKRKSGWSINEIFL